MGPIRFEPRAGPARIARLPASARPKQPGCLKVPGTSVVQIATCKGIGPGEAFLTRNGCCLLGLVPSGACLGAGAKEAHMSIVKMVELSAQSPDSWEEATRQAVERAARTLRNI